MVEKVKIYRGYAADAERMATQATDLHVTEGYKNVAREWHALADHIERDEKIQTTLFERP